MNINIAVTICFTAMSSTTNIIIACQDCAGKSLLQAVYERRMPDGITA
jgi:hypothetical protein